MATKATAVSDRAASYLRQPYARIVIPETDGTFRGEILEFPGCIATGDTPAEVLDTLEEVATEWLEAALESNQHIPEPIENTEFSGRLVLRMPKSLHKKAARLAEHDGVSLNQFIVTSLAEQVGERARVHGQITFNTAISSMNMGTFINYANSPQFPSFNTSGSFVGAFQGVSLTTHWTNMVAGPLRSVG